jgi:hypothetical protein
LLVLFFDSDDVGDVFLRNVYFHGLHGVISQKIQYKST